MPKIESGFAGERVIVLPQPFLELMNDNPLTGDLYVHSLGYIAHAQFHHVERPKGSEEYIFIYCTWGRGKITVGNDSFALTANQYVVLPKGVKHYYAADDFDPWTIYWIRFTGSKASIFSKKMEIPTTVLPSVYSRIEQRIELFESIYSVLCGKMSIEKLNYANICFSHFMASFLYIDLFRESSETTKLAEGMINRVTHFMNENLENKLTLRDIATYAGYSESYFYRKFIAETGLAPIDYFIHMKINKASIYLIKTSMNVSQIASKLGFNSADYFSRTFTRIVGISATEFRKQNFRL